MKFTIEIYVSLKKSILDPQGKAVEQGAHALSMDYVSDIRVGNNISFDVDAESENQAKERANLLCDKLLVNPVMEDYTIKVLQDA